MQLHSGWRAIKAQRATAACRTAAAFHKWQKGKSQRRQPQKSKDFDRLLGVFLTPIITLPLWWISNSEPGILYQDPIHGPSTYISTNSGAALTMRGGGVQMRRDLLSELVSHTSPPRKWGEYFQAQNIHKKPITFPDPKQHQALAALKSPSVGNWAIHLGSACH